MSADLLFTLSTPLVLRLMLLALALPMTAAAQPALPRFEIGECPFPRNEWARDVRLECGVLVVPEVRERPQGRTVRIAVAILRATQPSGAPPLVLLHGGPGGDGVTSLTRAAASWPLRGRDVVIYDQRGAGLSEPKPCSDLIDDIDEVRNRRTRAAREEGAVTVASACRASMKAQDVEVGTFGTSTNVADLIDLRKVLGYQTWDVYGVSYGALLAQVAMRRDPQGIRSVVLDSPGMLDPAVAAERALSTERAFDRVLQGCSAQPSCRAAFPALDEDLAAVYTALNETPIDVQLERGGAPTTVSIDGERLLRQLTAWLMTPQRIAQVPALLSELRRGDRMRAARLLLGTRGDLTPLDPLPALVICHDIYGEEYRASTESVRSRLRPMFRGLTNDLADCKVWQTALADPSERTPVQSGIPALILTGEFDPLVRPEHARRLTTTLPRARWYELAGEGHGSPPTGCKASIMLQFLENPTREPDASCVAAAPRLTFAARLPEPTLALVITATGRPYERFAGEWQAEFAGQTTILLNAAGPTLTGTILYVIPAQSGTIDIYDGRIDDTTMTFKVKSPSGDRTITFTATLIATDEMRFQRDVEVAAGGAAGGAGIFGALGARTFTAKRVQ